ncbi:MAG TPA: transcriptional repressor LexA [Clostridia bacterium]|nr:transcriptional repressor LexA [Clostridia bacterium]
MSEKTMDKKQEIIDFLNKHVRENGYPPSVREICKAVGFKSTSTVHSYLVKLDKEGLICKCATKPRALKIVKNNPAFQSDVEDFILPSREMVNVPIIGKVTAGLPILAIENIEDSFPVPVDYTHNSNVFLLRVRGESMIDAGILDGDLILVKEQSTAKNGDMVVALIEDEATVKTFYREKDHIRLQPENKLMEPIIVRDNMKILGLVIGVMRFFN